MGLIGFIKHQWEIYKLSQESQRLQVRFKDMLADMKKLSTIEFKAKYQGNPPRAWALMRGEKEKLRQRAVQLGMGG